MWYRSGACVRASVGWTGWKLSEVSEATISAARGPGGAEGATDVGDIEARSVGASADNGLG